MNNLPAPKPLPFPPSIRQRQGWDSIAAVFDERAERERTLATFCRGQQRERHLMRAEVLDEAAAFCRRQAQQEG